MALMASSIISLAAQVPSAKFVVMDGTPADSPIDIAAMGKWDEYTAQRDLMIATTHSAHAPWTVIRSNDKRRARLNIISHLLSQIPYEEIPRDAIKLPKRQKPNGYEEPDYARHWVPEKY